MIDNSEIFTQSQDDTLVRLKSKKILLPEKVYIEYLQSIHNIRFTLRQIDVIACEAARFSAKETAQFLSTKDKSLGDSGIEAHKADIRDKIDKVTRDIEQFAKGSDKYDFIKLHYSSLLLRKEFEKLLEKDLKKLFKHNNFSFIFVANEKIVNPYTKDFIKLTEEAKNDSLLIKYLKAHLEYIGQNVTVQVDSNKFLADSHSIEKQKEQFIIYLVSSNEIKIFEEKNELDNNSTTATSKSSLFLLKDEKIQSNNIPAVYKYINITEHGNYYSLFFEILKQLVPNIDINQLVNEFNKIYEKLVENSMSPRTFINNVSNQNFNDLNLNGENDEKITYFLKKYFWFFISFSALLLIIFLFILYSSINYSSRYNYKQSDISNLQSQPSIQETLTKYYEGLSTRNLTEEEVEKNYNVVEQFKEIIEQIDSGEIWKSFNTKGLEHNKLTNCLYNLNAVVCYCIFHGYDKGQTEKIVKYAKAIAEDYVSKRSKLKIDFDQLTPAEVYTEFSIIKDLPEMYAITMYFLGRNYLLKKDLEIAEKYFKLSKYLGERSNLFEDFLSTTNGLVMIENDKVDIYIRQGEYGKAIQGLKKCIEIYQAAKVDNKKYIKNYRPNNQNPVTIIPKKDVTNVIDCSRRLIKLYTKLAGITDDISENKKYLEAVLNELISNNSTSQELLSLIESGSITARIVPDLYNSLGSFLLKMNDINIEFIEIKNNLVGKLNLIDGDDLQLIEQIFELAKSLSRNKDYTKADAYDGLAKVYQKMMEHPDITKQDKDILLKKIQNYKKERDKINKGLGRDIAYSRLTIPILFQLGIKKFSCFVNSAMIA